VIIKAEPGRGAGVGRKVARATTLDVTRSGCARVPPELTSKRPTRSGRPAGRDVDGRAAAGQAGTAREQDRLLTELLSPPIDHVDDQVERRALDAQRQLARAGHHRLPPVAPIVAAPADIHGWGILHDDNGLRGRADRTDLRFGSVWLAPRGSI